MGSWMNPSLVGDDSVGTVQLKDDAVTNPKLADMAQARVKGRASGAGTGDPADLTATQVRALLNVEDGADVTDAANVDAAGAVMETDYDAQTVLAATADDTPAPVTLAEQRVLGRATGGNVAALTPAQVLAIIQEALDTGSLQVGEKLVAGGTADYSASADVKASFGDGNGSCSLVLMGDFGGGETRRLNFAQGGPLSSIIGALAYDVDGQVVKLQSGGTVDVFTVDFNGDAHVIRHLEVDGDLNHDGSNIGFNGAAPVAQGAAISDASGGPTTDAEARTAINSLLAYLRSRGDIAT